MAIVTDVQGAELAHLLDFTGELSGKRVLDIGSGDGRMVKLYSGSARQVVGIEPNAEKVQRAIEILPPELRGRVEYLPLNLEQYSARQGNKESREKFDLAFLGWSL